MQTPLFDLLKDQDQQKQAKQEEERKKLLEHISSATTNTLRDRVAWILNHHPETRDSDIALQIKFWETFETNIFNGYSISPADLYKLTRLTSIARERARIQNIYKLFLASSEVERNAEHFRKKKKIKLLRTNRQVGLHLLCIWMRAEKMPVNLS